MTDNSDHPQYKVGILVTVESRTWPGINKPGGVGKITKFWRDDDGVERVNVKYVLGGSEKNIEVIWVKPQVDLDRASRRKDTDEDKDIEEKENQVGGRRSRVTTREKNDQDNQSSNKKSVRNGSEKTTNTKVTYSGRRGSRRSAPVLSKPKPRSPRLSQGKPGRITIYDDSEDQKKNTTSHRSKGVRKVFQTKSGTQTKRSKSKPSIGNDQQTSIKTSSVVKKSRVSKRDLEVNPAEDNPGHGESPKKKKKPLSTLTVENVNSPHTTEEDDLVKKVDSPTSTNICPKRIEAFTMLMGDVMRNQAVSDSIKLDDLLVEVNKRSVIQDKYTEVEIRSCIKALEDENRVFLAESGMVYSI